MAIDLERISTGFAPAVKDLLLEMDEQLKVHRPSNYYVTMNQYKRIESEADRVSKPGMSGELFYRGIRVVGL